MSASFLSIPYELREQILVPLICRKGNVELQYPTPDKTAFAFPITRVCKSLREEAIRLFYRTNVFLWTIDPEAINFADPTAWLLGRGSVFDKHCGPIGPLESILPWHSRSIMQDLRHLRVNIWLPDPYGTTSWENGLAAQLAMFVEIVERGKRLQSLRVLIATWHNFTTLNVRQTAVLGVLNSTRVRGDVQVRTRSLGKITETILYGLNLHRHMLDPETRHARRAQGVCGVEENDLDWEWEGGVVI